MDFLQRILDSVLASQAFGVFAIAAALYIGLWVHRNRHLLMAAALLCLVGYAAYLYMGKQNLQKEVALVSDVPEASSTAAHNPGNIRVASIQFPGEVHSAGPFKRFASEADGFRAMARLLQTYVRSGHNTLRRITARYAPKGDGANDPDAYARVVSRSSGVPVDRELGMTDFRTQNIPNILYAMARVEQGRAPDLMELARGYGEFMREDLR